MLQRVHWIDIVKYIGIFFVILGHTLKDNLLLLWIYSFHMPLFFFLSGYLIEPRNKIHEYKVFLWKKSKSLLLPFVFFRVLLVSYWFLVERYFRDLDLGPIWFLIVLFFVEIVFAPILLKRKNKCHYIMVTTVCILLFYVLKSVYTDILFIHQLIGWAERILNGGIWFSLAFLVRKCQREWKITNWISHVILVVAIIISVLGFKYNGNVSIFSNTVNNIGLYLLLGMCGICIIMMISKEYIKQQAFLEKIGNYTIIILAIHEPIKRIIIKLVDCYVFFGGGDYTSKCFSCNFHVNSCFIIVLTCG